MNKRCRGCDEKHPILTLNHDWTYLTDYFGFSGWFCSKCYRAVSHNAYGCPKHPTKYAAMIVKIGANPNSINDIKFKTLAIVRATNQNR